MILLGHFKFLPYPWDAILFIPRTAFMCYFSQMPFHWSLFSVRLERRLILTNLITSKSDSIQLSLQRLKGAWTVERNKRLCTLSVYLNLKLKLVFSLINIVLCSYNCLSQREWFYGFLWRQPLWNTSSCSLQACSNLACNSVRLFSWNERV